MPPYGFEVCIEIVFCEMNHFLLFMLQSLDSLVLVPWYSSWIIEAYILLMTLVMFFIKLLQEVLMEINPINSTFFQVNITTRPHQMFKFKYILLFFALQKIKLVVFLK